MTGAHEDKGERTKASRPRALAAAVGRGVEGAQSGGCRERLHHCVRGFPRAPQRRGRLHKGDVGRQLEVGKGLA